MFPFKLPSKQNHFFTSQPTYSPEENKFTLLPTLCDPLKILEKKEEGKGEEKIFA